MYTKAVTLFFGEAADVKYWRKPLDWDQMEVPRGEVHIIADRCKGCSFCVEYCPKDVLVMSDEFNVKGYHPPKVIKDGECVNCNLCEMICPEFAIWTTAGPNGKLGSPEEVIRPTTEVITSQ